MKKFILSIVTLSLLVNVAFSEETSTECPMMKDVNVRNNPKANIASIKPKPKQTKDSASVQ
jgi:hypothetical protein